VVLVRAGEDVTGPCCHLCRARTEIVRGAADPTLWWCTDIPGCNFRARRRLGVGREAAVELWLTETFALLAAAIRTASSDRELDEAAARFGLRPLTWRGPSKRRAA
jgi:hypothetical protein